MKLTYDEQADIDRHERITRLLNEIVNGQPGYDEDTLASIQNYLRPLIIQYGFPNIEKHFTGDPFGIYEAAHDHKEEISYVLKEHKRRLDPLWKHHLMSKKISDMTGYEYITYLELAGKAGS